MITATTRVSDALAERPELRDVLSAFHPAFARLHHPVLGRVLPRLVTVADAARIAGVDADILVAVMNCPVGPPGAAAAKAAAVGSAAARNPVRPPPTEAPPWFDAARVTVLDVRPVLATGEDPLSRILGAVRALPAGGQLTVIASFEPVPLVGLLARQGWGAWARWDGDACHVTFGRGAPQAPEKTAPPASTAVRTPDGWSLDVRVLPPPEPMRQVLAAVDADQLPLRILHSREPALLWPHLQERHLAWTVTPTAEGIVIDVRRT
ncbi:MAG: DUF2249 domain-containing protein [Pseudomonadota bacterium]|nr:DUF2249 domain-containing protein [Pseudomonadota bacterium]